MGRHLFNQQCIAQDIEHRLTPPRHPQNNAMVERFNGRISKVVRRTRFASAQEPGLTLANYVNNYNHHISQRALKHLSPIEALHDCRKKSPDLFVSQLS